MSTAFGRLYAANTLGAIIGAGVAGFALIELLGLTGTLVAGAIASATAGLVALLLDSRRARSTIDPLPPHAVQVVSPTEPVNVRPGVARTIAFVSGLTALGYQVLWTRLLANGTGNSTYVFTFILVVFLIGLTLGAAIFNLVRRGIRDPLNVLALAQVGIAFLVIEGLVLVVDHPAGLPYAYGAVGNLLTSLGPAVVLVVLPPTLVMGFSLPVLSSLMTSDDRRVGEGTGSLLAVNTVGSIGGTSLIPFLVIPIIGSPHAVVLLALVNAVTGVAIAFRGRVAAVLPRRMTGGIGLVAVLVVAAIAIVPGLAIDPGLASVTRLGATVYASAEDDIASVQAGQLGFRRLWVTGVSMTALTVDTRMMPVLPLMLRPQSKTALIVGFGMGAAYRSSLIAGLTTDCVELVPSVPDMFRWYFADSASVLADPRGRVIIGDGRNYVELTDRSYDIIVVDPPPPIESSGVSVISSLEWYQAAHRRLNPGGVMMQWVPYGQTVDEFRAHLRTFEAVYPHVLVARGPGGNGFLMFGSDAPLAFDDGAIRQVLARPGVREDISTAFDSGRTTVDEWARAIPTLAWLGDERLSRFAGTGPLITDDHPLPEYFLLRHQFGSPSPMMSPEIANAAAAAP
jgi:spermidine synthase